MKRDLSFLVFLGLLLFAAAAGASQIIVIEAPSLIGTVTPTEWITGTVDLPGDVATVLSARLELSGYAEAGVIYCPGHEPFPSTVIITAYFDNSCIGQDGYFYAHLLDSDGQDELEGEVDLSGEVSWEPFMGSEAPWWCWIDGQLAIQIHDSQGYPLPCHGDPDPFLEITAARLILEVEPVVSTQAMSWGALKSFYR